MVRRKKKKTSRRRQRKRTRVKVNQEQRALRLWLGRNALVLLCLVAVFYIAYLDSVIRFEFEGKRWSLPAHVFARPLELYPGLALDAAAFEQELELLQYHRSFARHRVGSFERRADSFKVNSRPFDFPDGREASVGFRVRFADGVVSRLQSLTSGRELSLVRLDPFRFANISPAHHEDRILVQRQALPPILVEALESVEDRRFREHSGLDFRGLARAFLANIKAGRVVQGGSTLTQQLIKNYFLTRERTLTRKAKEALMAVLLELHYEKDEILEAYCNEVYLGQDGVRAIHGFGLAAQFYFGRELSDLEVHEIALLVGLVKGPSYYDPRRHPDRAKQRRDHVLTILAEQGVVSTATAQAAKRHDLAVTPRAPAISRFPAFADLAKLQLRRDYKEEDLRSEGLRVFTTLDPITQQQAERAVSERLKRFETQRGFPSQTLQGAMVVTNSANGEVLAVIGGRNPRAAGFNRALLAERQIGSLIKPVVYLSALRNPDYTVITPVDDAPFAMEDELGQMWAPKNFDQQSHGVVPLFQALAQSYNIATVRLGMDVGLPKVVETIKDLGVSKAVPMYPSLLLGAAEMAPLDVVQMYQTLIGGGFYTPLRAIRAVVSSQGDALQRYGLEVDQRIAPEPIYIINSMMQEVVREGTARGLSHRFARELGFGGKTGTSNDMRDSWFVGFTGDKLAAVWVGRDDNQPSGYSGASGAMQVWADFFSRSPLRAVELPKPSTVEWVWVDPVAMQRSAERCSGAIELPFIVGTAPAQSIDCGGTGDAPLDKTVDWFKEFFD